MGPFLGMNSRVHPKYKTKYRVSNWAKYDRALVERGNITMWVSDYAIASWKPASAGRRGGQRKFSDHAIETALMLRLVFKLPLRQAEGFMRSILSLMDIDLEAPDHTTLSRRRSTFEKCDAIASTTISVKCSRQHSHEGARDRASPVEEGVGIPPAGPSGKHLLPIQVDHWRPAACASSQVTGGRGADRMQYPEPDDGA